VPPSLYQLSALTRRAERVEARELGVATPAGESRPCERWRSVEVDASSSSSKSMSSLGIIPGPIEAVRRDGPALKRACVDENTLCTSVTSVLCAPTPVCKHLNKLNYYQQSVNRHLPSGHAVADFACNSSCMDDIRVGLTSSRVSRPRSIVGRESLYRFRPEVSFVRRKTADSASLILRQFLRGLSLAGMKEVMGAGRNGG